MIHGAERVEPLEQWRLKFKDGDVERVYNLKWKDAEQEGDTFLRREDPLYESWLAEAILIHRSPILSDNREHQMLFFTNSIIGKFIDGQDTLQMRMCIQERNVPLRVGVVKADFDGW